MANQSSSFARRSFIKDSGLMIAGGAISGAMAVGQSVHGESSSPLKIALVGCGRRGRELIDAALAVESESVQLVGLGDLFASQVQAMYRSVKGRHASSVADHCVRANGINCLDAILKTDADVVYLATPPVCRPQHFRQVVTAGRHAFLEKPLAADVPGVLHMLETSGAAKQAGLCVHVGFQRRYDKRYQDVIAKVHEGLLGTPIFARAYCNAGPMRKLQRIAGESDVEFQLRNWNHFQWTGGDFLVEQHVAGLDVIHWAVGRLPSVAQGQGGWGVFEAVPGQTAADSRQGEVFDHHSVEYEFEGSLTLMSQCRRVAKAWNNTSEHLHGTAGRADLTDAKIYSADGSLRWTSKHPNHPKSATAEQQRAFFAAIRGATAENQVAAAADSTLFALLGHAATATGRKVRFDKLISGASGQAAVG
jgi:predicted dehydrogenase